MHVYNHQLPATAHGAMNINPLDVPASQKIQGAASHSHSKHNVISVSFFLKRSTQRKDMIPPVKSSSSSFQLSNFM